MSTYEMHIDPTSAEAGAERIVKSFESIKAAAGRMEGGVVASANKMAAAWRQLSNVRTISREAVSRLTELSSALSKFRGPSKTSVDNTAALLSVLGRYGNVRAPAAGPLSAFLTATSRYTGPTPQAGRNLSNLLKALNSFNGVSGIGSRVNSFLAALANFRGPSANAGRNVQALFAALKSFTGLPKGFASSGQAFISFAAAIDRATAAFTRLRAVAGEKISGPGGALKAPAVDTGNIRKAVRDYNFLETAIFRTQTAMNALGGVLAGKAILAASNDVLKARAQLEAATGSVTQAGTQFEYVRSVASNMGLEFRSLARSYGLFLGSVKGTNVTIGEAQQIFSGFATAGRALQLSTDDMDGIFRALGQIMSKGKLQAEELRGQLGDRLPGAFTRMAAALGLSTQELDAQMKKGLISGKRLQDGLMNLSLMLQNEFAGSAEKASKTVDAAFNRLKNAFTFAAAGMGKAGLNEGLINIADGLRKLLESDSVAVLMQGIGKAFKFVGDNANLMASVLGGVAVASMAKWVAEASKASTLMDRLKNFGQTVSTAATTGYQAGAQAMGAPSSTATIAAGAAADKASTSMNAFAAANTRAAAASDIQAAAANQSAVSTTLAGRAADSSTVKFNSLTSTVGSVGGDARKAAAGLTTFSNGLSGMAVSASSTAGAVSTTANALNVLDNGAQTAAQSGTVLAGSFGKLADSTTKVASSSGAVVASVAAQTEGFAAATTGAGLLTTATNGFVTSQGRAAVATEVTTGAVVAESVAMRASTAIVGYASAAWSVFRAVLVTVPFVAVGVAIAGLVGWLSTLKSKSEEAREAMDSLSSSQEVGSRVLTNYAAYLDSAASALDRNTASLRLNTAETIRNNIAKSMGADYGVSYGQANKGGTIKGTGAGVMEIMGASAMGLSLDADRDPRGQKAQTAGGYMVYNGQKIPRDLYNQIAPLVQVQKGKVIARTQYRNSRQYAQAMLALGQLNARRQAGGVDPTLTDFVDKVIADQTRIQGGYATSAKLDPNKAPFRADIVSDTVNRLLQDSAKSAGAGAAAAGGGGGGKKNKGRSGAGVANADAQDLRRALETVRDLNREISNADAAIAALNGPGANAIAEAARSAAQAKLDNIEDSFGTVERARKGIMDFAGQIKAQAQDTVTAVEQAQSLIDKAASGDVTIPADKLAAAKQLIARYGDDEISQLEKIKSANIDTYETSKQTALDYLAALEKTAAARKKELELAQSIATQQAELATKTGQYIPGTELNGKGRRGVDMVAATRAGGRELQQATILQEALQEAIGVSADKYDDYVKKLVAAKTAQAEFNRQLEMAQKLHENELERQAITERAGLIGSGMSPKEIEAQMQLRNYQRELLDKGYSNADVNKMVAAEAQMIKLRSAAADLEDGFAKVQQASQDMADAIVDGFKQGINSGEGFGKTIKSIINDVKNILLDFVLYNPLKQFLRDTLTGVMQPSLGTGNVQTGTMPSIGLGSLFGVGGSLGSILGGVADGTFNGTPTRGDGGIISMLGGGAISQPTLEIGGNATVQLPDAAAQDIIVNGVPGQQPPLNQVQQGLTTSSAFGGLKNMFNFTKNMGTLKEGIGNLGKVFGKGGLSALGKGLGQIAGVAAQAFGAFSIGQGVGKMLGLGRTGSNVLGGAAAGFSVGGPIGAAIGGAIGLVGSLLGGSKKPQARGSITVGDNGRAVAGATYSKDKGDKEGVTQLTGAGASLFTRVATSLDSYLTAGNYGTFGSYGKGDKAVQFYSLTGLVDKKGKPKGVAGVDYLKGTPDELNAFALKKQISAGKFGDLNPVYKTIAQNSTATGMDALSADLEVGKSFIDFIDKAKMFTETEQAVKDLDKTFESLQRQSKALGLDTNKLATAYNILRTRMKGDFDFNINQGILGIKDPIMAEYNALVKDYENAVRDANAVGGNLAAVEEYYGLQRAELIKKYMQQANDSIKKSADDLYRQLTATDSSPLNAQTVFSNAQGNYFGLMDQIKRGDYTNFGNLNQYTQDYLSAAQGLYSSSPEFYDIFKQVTDFTKQAGMFAPDATTTNPENLPGLPSLEAIQQRIADSTAALADSSQQNTEATQNVGQTLLDTNSLLAQIYQQLAANGVTAGSLLGIPGYGLSTLQTAG